MRDDPEPSEASVGATESNADEEVAEAERFATAGALDGDASKLIAAPFQKDATIKTKNVQP